MRVHLMFILMALVVPARNLAGQEHVVTPAELHKTIQSAAEARQGHVTTLQKFLVTEPAKKALKGAGLDGSKLVKAVPLLTDEELARLAARAEKVQKDFAVGALSNQELTYIVIALATAVVILVIVAA